MRGTTTDPKTVKNRNLKKTISYSDTFIRLRGASGLRSIKKYRNEKHFKKKNLLVYYLTLFNQQKNK